MDVSSEKHVSYPGYVVYNIYARSSVAPAAESRRRPDLVLLKISYVVSAYIIMYDNNCGKKYFSTSKDYKIGTKFSARAARARLVRLTHFKTLQVAPAATNNTAN